MLRPHISEGDSSIHCVVARSKFNAVAVVVLSQPQGAAIKMTRQWSQPVKNISSNEGFMMTEAISLISSLLRLVSSFWYILVNYLPAFSVRLADKSDFVILPKYD